MRSSRAVTLSKIMRFAWQIGFILIFMAGCAGSRKSRPEAEPEGVRNFELMREDFDPQSLDDDDIIIEEIAESTGDIDQILTDPKDTVLDSVTTGYRVQLIQTTDPEEARNVQKDAILQFDYEIYRVFDPPFYKIRVGDFAEWRDAENLQQEAIKRGYREAWVIRTKVNLKNATTDLDNM